MALLKKFVMGDKAVRMVSDKVFDKFDTDRSGTLDQSEMQAVLDAVKGKLNLPLPAGAIMKMLDTDRSGTVDKEELFQVIKRVVSLGGQKH